MSDDNILFSDKMREQANIGLSSHTIYIGLVMNLCLQDIC